jgi:hypothetical protein
MTREPGSDSMLPADHDPLRIVINEHLRQLAEEARVRAILLAAHREPGEDHAQPDAPPPADGAPEFDPLPSG